MASRQPLKNGGLQLRAYLKSTPHRAFLRAYLALCVFGLYGVEGFLVGPRLQAQAKAGRTGALSAPPSGALPVPQLVDITESTEIRFEHLSSPEQKYIVESMSVGVALTDYDGDGGLDIYFTGAPSVAMELEDKKARSALYQNNHNGIFTDVTEKAGVGTPCWAMGAAVGDYNNDGRPDLIVSCFGGVILYRNNGDGTFTDVTKAAHLDKDPGWATGVAFGDYGKVVPA